MTNEKFERLLQEFLLHKDSSHLKEYVAGLLRPAGSIQTSKGLDSGKSNSLPTNASIFDFEPVESILELGEVDSEETIGLPPSEIVDVSQDLEPQFDIEFSMMSDQSRENSMSKPEGASDQTFPGQTGYFSKMSIEEIAFPEPSDISQVTLGESSLIGPYRRQKLLGKGGMGMVWQVRDPMLQRTVALKILHTAFCEDASTRMYFNEEAQINAQLQHPGILPVYSYAKTDSEVPYLTMKEVRGTTLKDIIQELYIMPRGSTTSDGWNIRRLVTAFQSVCETMAYAHSKGVIHRDLKPSNIMVGKFGEVLVVDWGIAKVMQMPVPSEDDEPVVVTNRSRSGKTEEPGLVLGTPAYMSPEQASGYVYAIDHRSDIYSLGVILYQILTGETYHKGSIQEILQQKSTGRRYVDMGIEFPDTDADETTRFSVPILPEDLDSDDTSTFTETFLPPKFIGLSLPQSLIRICEKAMQFNIEDRYYDALDMASDIRSWLDGAERKEKAMKILSQVQDIEQTQVTLLHRRFEVWSKAETQMKLNGVESATAWDLWGESLDLHEQIEENRQEMHHLLQGALVYDPELTETHQKLVAFEYEDYLKALLDVDLKRQQKIRRRMRIYLESLPHEEANHWNERQQKDHKATTLLRKKRGGFVGRRIQINQINAGLSEHKLVTLVGTAGVGKTHLVLEVSNQWRNIEGQESIFCDLTTATDLLAIEQELSKVLSIVLTPKDPWKQIGKALDESGKTLLIFDNVEQVIGPANEAVQKMLTSCTDLNLIVTSRLKLGRGDEQVIRLEPMSILEGVELFLQRAQKAYPDFTLTEKNRHIVGQIVNKLDRLPLAIELAAARASTLQVTEILDRLSERFSLLQGRMRSTDKPALLGALDWSWDLLSEEVQYAFAQCSVFRNGFDLPAAEAIIDVSNFENSPSVMDMIEALYDDNLLNKERQNDGRFRYALLASIQEYTSHKFTELHHEGASIERAPQRHAKYYGDLFHTVEESVAANLLRAELDNVMIGVAKGEPEDAYRCCTTALSHFGSKGPILRGIELANVLLARNDVDATHYMSVQMSKIRFLRISGQMKEARLEMKRTQTKSPSMQAKADSPTAEQSNSENPTFESKSQPGLIETPSDERSTEREDTDRAHPIVQIVDEIVDKISDEEKQRLILQAEALIEQGNLHEVASVYEDALASYKDALEIYSEVQDARGITKVYLHIAKIQYLKGDIDLTRKMCLEALTLAEANHLFMLKADALTQMGEVDRKTGEYQTALERFKQSLQISIEREDRFRQEHNLGRIGLIYESIGEYTIAIEHYQEALQISTELGYKRNQSVHLANLAVVHEHLGDYERATVQYQKALAIAEELGSKRNIGVYLGNLGSVLRVRGLVTEAIEYIRQAIQIAQEIGDHQSEAVHLSSIGNLYNGSGRYSEAIDSYTRAGQLFKRSDDKRREAAVLNNLGNVQKSLGNYEIAIEHYRNTLEIMREIGNKPSEGVILGNIGELLIQVQRWEEAERHLKSAIELCKSKIPVAAGAFMGSLAWLYAQQSKMEQARKLLRDGEPLVEVYPEEQGKFLCKKSKILHMVGESNKAKESLEQAKVIAKEIDSGENSELGTLISDTEPFLLSMVRLESKDTSSLGFVAKELTDERNQQLKIQADMLLEQGDLDETQSLYDEALTAYDAALQIYSTIQDARGITQVHLHIAKIHYLKGDIDLTRKMCLEALTLAEANHLFMLKADVLSQMGEVDRKTGEYQTALERFKQSLQISIEREDRFRQEHNLGRIGLIYESIGEYTIAIEHYQEALQISTELGYKRNQSIHLANLGLIHEHLGDYDRAMEHYQKALTIAEELGSKRSIGTYLGNLGNILQKRGLLAESIEHMMQAIQIAQEIGDHQSEGVHLSNIGNLYNGSGQYLEAMDSYTRAIQIFKRGDDKRSEAGALGNLANVQKSLGNYEVAIEHYQNTLDITRDIGNKLSEGINLGNLGDLFMLVQRWEEAERYLILSIELCRLTIPAASGAFMGSLAWLYAQQSKMARARELLREGEPFVEVYPEEHGKFLCKKSKVLHMLGESNQAKESLEQSRAIAQKINSGENSDLGKLITETEQFLSSVSQTNSKDTSSSDLVAKDVSEDEIQQLKTRASLLLERGDLDEAESLYASAIENYQQAFELCLKIGDAEGITRCHLKLGVSNRRLGNYEIAQSELKSALQLSKTHRLPSLHAHALTDLAIIQSLQGAHKIALSLYEQALQISSEIGDKLNAECTLGAIGDVYNTRGEHEEAITHYTLALQLAREIGHRRNEGIHLGNLGNTFHQLGDYVQAMSHHTSALNISRETANQQFEAMNLGNLGNVCQALEDYEQAEVYYLKAIEISQSVGDKRNQGIQRGNLGNLYITLGKWEVAEQNLLESIRLSTKLLPAAAGACMGSLAWLYAQQSKDEQACEILEKGEPMVDVFPFEHAKFLCKKSKVLHMVRESNQAKASLEQSRVISQKINSGENSELGKLIAETEQFISSVLQTNPKDTSSSDLVAKEVSDERSQRLTIQADMLTEQGDLDEVESLYDNALDSFTQALDIYTQIDHLKGVATAHYKIGVIHRRQANFDLAVQEIQKAFEHSVTHSIKTLTADSLSELGLIQRLTANYTTAMERYQRALEISRELGDRRREELNLGTIGEVYRQLGEYDKALECCKQCLAIAQEMGLRRSEGHKLGTIATIHMELGVSEQAIVYFEQAIQIAEEINDQRNLSAHLGNLGSVYLGLKQYDKVIICYKRAIQISKVIGDKVNLGIQFGNLGILYVKMRDWNLAADSLQESVEICESLNYPAHHAFRGVLARVNAQLGQIQLALDLISYSDQKLRGIPLEHGKYLCNKAIVLILAKQASESLDVIQEAKSIADELNIQSNSELGQIISEAEEMFMQSLLGNSTPYDSSSDSDRPASDVRDVVVDGQRSGIESEGLRVSESTLQPSNSMATESNAIVGLTEEQRQQLKTRAEILLEQGDLDEAESLYDEALNSYAESLQIHRQINNTSGVVKSHLKIGNVYKQQGEYEQATQACTRAKELAENNDLTNWHADALEQLGDIQMSLGRYPLAKDHFEHALTLVKELSDNLRESSLLNNLALVHLQFSEYEQGISYYTKALQIAKAVGNKRGQSEILENIGGIYFKQGEYPQSLKYYERSLHIAREIGNKKNEASSLRNLGNVHNFLGDLDRAIECLQQSLDITKEIGDKKGEGESCVHLGGMYDNAGDYKQAIAYYTESLNIAKSIGSKRGVAYSLGSLARMSSLLGETAKALDYYTHALEISRELENRHHEGVLLGNLGDIYIRLEKWIDAEDVLVQCIEICTALYPPAAGAFSGSLAWVYAKQSKMEEAKKLLSEGEPLVEVYPLEYGKFLCKKAKILHMVGEIDSVQEAIEQAKLISVKVSKTADSALVRLIAETTTFVETST